MGQEDGREGFLQEGGVDGELALMNNGVIGVARGEEHFDIRP